jgi:protein SCO1/2
MAAAARPTSPNALILRRKMPRQLLICAALLSVMLVTACGGSDGDDDTPAAKVESETVGSGPAFAAPLVLDPPKRAPDFTLRDYTGEMVTLSDYRGKAVMLTFIYANCPDVCQLIIQALASARRKLGPDANDMQIIAISVDPKGDTKAAVRRFLEARKLVGEARYLIGSAKELRAIWRRYGIQSKPDKAQPALIAHSAFIYGIDRDGMERTLYPSDPLDPNALAADVKLLVDA